MGQRCGKQQRYVVSSDESVSESSWSSMVNPNRSIKGKNRKKQSKSSTSTRTMTISSKTNGRNKSSFKRSRKNRCENRINKYYINGIYQYCKIIAFMMFKQTINLVKDFNSKQALLIMPKCDQPTMVEQPIDGMNTMENYYQGNQDVAMMNTGQTNGQMEMYHAKANIVYNEMNQPYQMVAPIGVQPPLIPIVGQDGGNYMQTKMAFKHSYEVPFLPPPPSSQTIEQARIALVEQPAKQNPQYIMLPNVHDYYAQLNDPYLQNKLMNYYEYRVKQYQPKIQYQIKCSQQRFYPPQMVPVIAASPTPPNSWQQQIAYLQSKETPIFYESRQPPVYIQGYNQLLNTEDNLINVQPPFASLYYQPKQQVQSTISDISEDQLNKVQQEIREIKQLIQDHDTKELTIKMDQSLEEFKKMVKMYAEVLRENGFGSKIGQSDSFVGERMNKLRSIYDDISLNLSLLSVDTKNVVTNAKGLSKYESNNEKSVHSNSDSLQRMNHKMEEMMRLINILKSSYSSEIMKTLTEKK
ncbi:hypothetical protein BLOT_002719 [Blomia tropicalis]|nr:hypothetical protein BLOT_002719 [Blomia tropicalis]